MTRVTNPTEVRRVHFPTKSVLIFRVIFRPILCFCWRILGQTCCFFRFEDIILECFVRMHIGANRLEDMEVYFLVGDIWQQTFSQMLFFVCWTVKQPQRLKRVSGNQFFSTDSRPFDLFFFSALSFKTLWRKHKSKEMLISFFKSLDCLVLARKCVKWMKCRNLEVAHSLQGRNAETRALCTLVLAKS